MQFKEEICIFKQNRKLTKLTNLKNSFNNLLCALLAMRKMSIINEEKRKKFTYH
jgi:hypothetical protein